MAKRPKDTPEIGDRCEWRGYGDRGTLVMVDTDNQWCSVRWDRGGPVIIHLYELKKLTSDNA